jgi:hypothetical protein
VRRPALLVVLLVVGCSGSLPEPRRGDHRGEISKAVPSMPPPGKVEIVPPRPKDMKDPVWIDGEWKWNDRRWVWEEHGWVDAPPGEVYAPPQTQRLPDGRIVHLPGVWKKPEPPRPPP